MSDVSSKYGKFKEDFIRATKRILKTTKPTKLETLDDILNDIVTSYNNYIKFVNSIYETLDVRSKTTVNTQFVQLNSKLKSSLKELGSKVKIPTSINEEIEITNLEENSEEEDTETLVDDKELLNSSQLELEKAKKPDHNKMEQVDFIKVCATTINVVFEGDALKLQPFLNAIELVKTLATTQVLQDTLFNFVKTKLSGKALESLATGTTTLDGIITALKDKIRPENSKVIEGRLAALRADRQSLQNFAKSAEELADSLKRSLVLEGMTIEKANEIATDKTIKMCRASARTDLIKSVLASSRFNEPKEVLSSFLIEVAQGVEEKNVRAYQVSRGNGRGGRNYRNRQNGGDGNYYNNNNYRGNRRGRGRGGRGGNGNNRQYNNANYNQNNSRNSNRPYNNSNHQNVRFAASGNEGAPVPHHRELEGTRDEI